MYFVVGSQDERLVVMVAVVVEVVAVVDRTQAAGDRTLD